MRQTKIIFGFLIALLLGIVIGHSLGIKQTIRQDLFSNIAACESYFKDNKHAMVKLLSIDDNVLMNAAMIESKSRIGTTTVFTVSSDRDTTITYIHSENELDLRLLPTHFYLIWNIDTDWICCIR